MSLEELVEGDDLDVAIEQPPAEIDEHLAVRLLARRRHRLAEQATFDEEWSRMMEPLLLHRAEVTERNRKEVERIETLLGQMLEAKRAADPKLTKLDLPGGTLRSRAQQPEWTYDVQAFMGWALSSDGPGRYMVRTKVEPDKAAAKKALHIPDGRPGDTVQAVTSDGEVVPGVTVTYRPRRLVVDS